MDRRTLLRNAAGYSGVALLGSLAGCAQGGGSDDTTTTTTSSPTEQSSDMRTPEATATTTRTTEGNTATASIAATVVVSSTETFGDILTDSKGMTLYLFTKDRPGESVCYDGCAETWPSLTMNGTAYPPSAKPDVTAQLDTLERKDGSIQVTVADHPLYYYVSDEMPGDTTGQGVGNVWFVVGPDGQKKTATTTTTTTTDDSSGYGGY